MQFRVINQLPKNSNGHFVLSAWFDDKTKLVRVVQTLKQAPPFTKPVGVGGLTGRITPGNLNQLINNPSGLKNPQVFWNSLREMCDLVNDSYESGTLLPTLPITLLPAFTFRPPFEELKAQKAITDVFLAHSLAIGQNLYVMLDHSDRGVDANWTRGAFQAAADQCDDSSICYFIV